jgi:tetratricopeptide (TPR) repeat protein
VAGGASAPAQPVIEVPTVVVTAATDEELGADFERATAQLVAGELRAAADGFDRILKLRAEGGLVPPSLFNAGLARQGLGEHEAAAQRFEELLRRYPEHELAQKARLRLAQTLAQLERWEALVAVADRLVAGTGLTALEEIEARGARALGLVEAGRVEEAAVEVSRARGIIEKNRFGEAGTPPGPLAQVAFALGEVRRARSEAITFDPLPPDFVAALEQRCQGLLDAQAAYTDAMRSLDARWSAMAGYRVGQLYQTLHADVMRISPPRGAETDADRQLFEGAMRLRYRVLLEKGLKMMEATVRIGERTGEESAWIERARAAKRDFERALEDERAALAKLPYSESELKAGLESLKKR